MRNVERFLDDLVLRYPALDVCRDDIMSAFLLMQESYSKRGKMLIAGNGGSASDAEHIVGELMKGFIKKRSLSLMEQKALLEVDEELGAALVSTLQHSLPAIAVTGHTALSTAFLNDVEGTLGFAQQVQGYGVEGDVLFGITTSGNSKNILYSFVVAKAKGMKTVALTGRDGGKVKDLADISIIVPEKETYKIQDLHLPIYHTLCLMLEDYFYEE